MLSRLAVACNLSESQIGAAHRLLKLGWQQQIDTLSYAITPHALFVQIVVIPQAFSMAS